MPRRSPPAQLLRLVVNKGAPAPRRTGEQSLKKAEAYINKAFDRIFSGKS